VRRFICATVLLTAALGGSTSAAGAEEAATVAGAGYWTDNPTTTAPEGGIAVGAAPGGRATSVAAVRVTLLSKSITSATLVLQESGGVNQSNGDLKVCTTPNQWKPGKGPMSEAPKAECAAEAKLARNATTGSWAGDIKNLLSGAGNESTVSLMVIPASGGAVPVGFDIQFRPPQVQAEGAASSTGFEAGSGFSEDEFSSDEFSSSGSSSGSGFSSSDFSGTTSTFSDFSAPMTGAELETAAAPVEATVAPAAGEGEGQVAVGLPARPAALTDEEGRPVVQALFFVFVAAAVGGVAGFGRNRIRRLQPS
jgi:hypothetical protein